MRLEIAFLLRPGRGQNRDGAFYIGVQDDKAPMVIYGTNSASGSGTVKSHSNAAEVRKKVREKSNKDYDPVSVTVINEAAKKTLLGELASKIPGLDIDSAVWDDSGITFGGGASRPKQRPKSRKPAFQHGWF